MSLFKEKKAFLEEFLKNAPFDGWNKKCLEATSLKLKKELNYGMILFPNGAIDIAAFFSSYIDEKMEEYLQENGINQAKIREKIHFLVMLRFSFYLPYKEAVRKLLRLHLTPTGFPKSLKMLWSTCDSFWHYIGDNSTDFNYYSKRFLLSCIYSRSLLYWLTDNSKDNEDTSLYLEKEIARVLKLGNLKKNFQDLNEKITKIPFLRLLLRKKKI